MVFAGQYQEMNLVLVGFFQKRKYMKSHSEDIKLNWKKVKMK